MFLFVLLVALVLVLEKALLEDGALGRDTGDVPVVCLCLAGEGDVVVEDGLGAVLGAL